MKVFVHVCVCVCVCVSVFSGKEKKKMCGRRESVTRRRCSLYSARQG